jgi:hypothetical protein
MEWLQKDRDSDVIVQALDDGRLPTADVTINDDLHVWSVGVEVGLIVMEMNDFKCIQIFNFQHTLKNKN